MNSENHQIYSGEKEVQAAINRGEPLVFITKPKNAAPPNDADFRRVAAAQEKRERKAEKRVRNSATANAYANPTH